MFVEGKDFRIISKFARKLGKVKVANRNEFSVVPVEGFNPERIRSVKNGIETALGGPIVAVAILDRDYRSYPERDSLAKACQAFCDQVIIHDRKEIENFLLVHEALDRAAERKVHEQNRRSGEDQAYAAQADGFLQTFSAERKKHVTAQYLRCVRQFARGDSSETDESVITEKALGEFEVAWRQPLHMISGKETLSSFNELLQEQFGVSVTPTAVIDAMQLEEIPEEVVDLIEHLVTFATTKPG